MHLNAENVSVRPVLRRPIGVYIGVLMVLVVLLQGCSIQQTITPVGDAKMAEITIIENPKVRDTFLSVLKSAIEEQGITTDMGPATSYPKDYAYALTYTANWRWDVTLYLVYAEIDIYERNKVIGKAIYDARGGDARLDKFINADSKVKELVSGLFGKGQAVKK